MKPFLFISILSLFLSKESFSQNATEEIKNETKLQISTSDIGWPEDIEGLIAHLNKWDKDELDAYERPEAYPNFKTSGETNGWILEHKKLLKEKGATVKWDHKLKVYVIKVN